MIIQIFPHVDIKELYGQSPMPNTYPALLKLCNANMYFKFLLAFKLKVNIFFYLYYDGLTGFFEKPRGKSDIWTYSKKENSLKLEKE